MGSGALKVLRRGPETHLEGKQMAGLGAEDAHAHDNQRSTPGAHGSRS